MSNENNVCENNDNEENNAVIMAENDNVQWNGVLMKAILMANINIIINEK
jgi:hypothetical protein